MKNNTLYASEITYEFENARLRWGNNRRKVLEAVKDKKRDNYPEKLEYLDDFYDKDTGTSRTPIKPTISRRPNKLFSNKYGRRK